MKDGFTQTTHRLNSRSVLFAALAVATLLCGCQQPVANSQARRPNLFPNLFGGQGLASNNTQRSYLGNERQLTPGGFAQGSFGAGGFSQTASAQRQGFGRGQIGQGRGAGQGLDGIAPVIQEPEYASISNELQGLNQRLSAYDADNQLLNTEVAALKQKLQLANQYSQTLKDQLADNSGRIQQAEFEKQSAMQQLAALQSQFNQNSRIAQNPNGAGFSNQVPAQQAGYSGDTQSQLSGATLRANNSLMRRFASIRIPGGQARMDGDVIRIEFPTDRLFVPGTYQVQPAQQPLLQNIVGTIRQNFPRQIVGIEAHWDNTPLNPPTTTHHQLTATQSLAVFDQLVRLGLPRNQMFTMAMASNRPRHPQGISGGVSPNRRIELVIYPETFDGT